MYICTYIFIFLYTRILVGILKVSAVVWQKACMHTIGANDIRAGEGLTWRRQQIDCTRLQVGARSSNQQHGRGVYALCLWPTMQYWGFLEGA